MIDIQNIISQINIDVNASNISTDEIVGVSFLTAKKFLNSNENICLLASNLYNAELLRDLLYSILGKENIIYIPSEEMLMAEYLASSKDIISDRIFGLYEATHAVHKILITNLTSVIRYYPNVTFFKENCFHISQGSTIDYINIKERLLNCGYEIVNKVDKSGQFAIRGDIIDIYPLTSDFPIRIDLFDDEIEKMSYFDISTQESFKEIIEAEIIPFTDLLYSECDLKNFEEKLLERSKFESLEFGNPSILMNTQNDIDSIKSLSKQQSLYKYFSFISGDNSGIFDYFHCRTLIFSNYDSFILNFNTAVKDGNEFIFKLFQEGKNIRDLTYYDEFALGKINCDEIIKNNDLKADCSQELAVRQPIFLINNLLDSKGSISKYVLDNYKIFMVFASNQQKDFYISNILNTLYKESDLEYLIDKKIFLGIGEMPIGIDFPDNNIVILTQKELFGYKNFTNKYTTKFKQGTILKSYDELLVGDFVVHENYGIGCYDGLKQIESDGKINDFIKIIYKDNDVLYVPLEQFKLIRKYVSKEGYAPSLSKLFSGKWDKTKEKIKAKVSDLADKLVKLYQERANKPGIAFAEDDIFQEQFDSCFEYQLTFDQQQAVNDVKKDMEASFPMDRLICGDVGFGKTEIAFRAAFKAINSGKQVLILCPTTILAKQHYERALERFSKFDIKIECLTRFLTARKFGAAVESINAGKSHLIIGTHKALSKKIDYSQLGLLIIDEEQRFGVEHKEKITMKYPYVDILTLSATPIPRTLQMSLVGMKQMSVINTAPKNRTPIQTYLVKFNMDVVCDLLSREMTRHGQAYYIVNSIERLYERAKQIEKVLINAKVAAIHGQMDKEDIDEIMTKFYEGEIDILVATTIVENGIDIANANLVIVEDANRFGLAQLYQIKGRVGRSNRLAYAYLMYRDTNKLDDVAKKRLKTIEEFTELGSGYKIAQRDLMIRGAGDILGAEQAGFINEVGIDLYLKILNDAIKEKENGIDKKKDIEYQKLDINGYIPNKYANENNKFEIYQFINDAETISQLDRTEEKIRDIYGSIPQEMYNLLINREIKIKLKENVFEKYIESKDDVSLFLAKEINSINGIGVSLFTKMMKYSNILKLTTSQGFIKIIIKKQKSWLNDFNDILNIILEIYKEKKNEIR